MRKIKQSVSGLWQEVRILLVFLRWHIAFFFAMVVLFGYLYTYLTPGGDGIGQNLDPYPNITFLTGIYFSIVTISSLGYGDMYPMGLSKVLACIEVLLGLVMIGVMIAKATSQRLSYRVAQERLEKFAEEFAIFHGDFDVIITNFRDAYQEVPSQTPSEDKSVLIARFQEIITKFQSQCTALHTFLSHEISQGNYFEIAPINAVVQVGNAVYGSFSSLGQLPTILSPQAKTEVLNRPSRQGISRAIDTQIKACSLVDQYATDQGTRDVFQNLEHTCTRLLEYYSVLPKEPQPDQVLQDADNPQQPSGVNDE